MASSQSSSKLRVKSPLNNHWAGSRKKVEQEIKSSSSVVPQPPSHDAATEKPRILDVKEATTSLEFLIATLSDKLHLSQPQVLGLLSNSNKYLIQVIIKGLKGNYKVVTEWYKELYTNAGSLVEILAVERDSTTAALQILDILKAGLFCKNVDIAIWACRVLAKMSGELNEKGMSGLAWDWFTAENGGLHGVMYCVDKNRNIVAENAIAVLCQFGKYNFTELFTHSLKVFYNDICDYMKTVSFFMQALAEYKPSRDGVISGGVLTFWIDLGCRKGDIEGNNPTERAAALNMLFEIWANFPNVIEEKAEYADYIIKLMQRANRDRNANLQFVSLALLFKLLDVFALERNPYAPIAYKTLTFALVENHQKGALREFILAISMQTQGNFKTVFESSTTIPVSILIEPFIKQIRKSEGVTFVFNSHDFDFFLAVAKHPKLSVKNAIQILDLLAKQYLYDPLYAVYAINSFMTICNRLKKKTAFRNFIGKLIKFFINIYKANQKKSILQSARKLQAQASKDSYLLMKAQNERILEIIGRIIQLGQEEILSDMKYILAEAHKYLTTILSGEDIRLRILLENLGDVDELIKNYEEQVAAESAREEDDFAQASPRAASKSGDKLLRESEDKMREIQDKLAKALKASPTKNFETTTGNTAIGVPGDTDRIGDRSVISDREMGRAGSQDFGTKVPYPKDYNIVPYKQLSLLEEKALLEIERMRQKKEERIEKQRIEKKRKQLQEEKRKEALKKQLEIRKVELNVATRNMKDVMETMMLEEGLYEKADPKKAILPEIQLMKIEEEEDKDYEALKLFVEQRKKLFRYLYNKYANSGFSIKKGTSFDALKEKLETISIAEITRMFKEHNITLRMLSHAELAAFFRLVNFKLIHKSDLSALTYEGFVELFIQVAIYIFSKEPYCLSHLSPMGLVEKALDHFKQAAKIRGENTQLYDNCSITSLGDPELVSELTKCVETNPFYPLPEGYKKVEEKSMLENFKIANYFEIPESTRIASEILDSVLGKSLGIHIIEPIITYEYLPKVIPTIGKAYQRDPSEKHFMLPLTKSPKKSVFEPIKKGATLKEMNTEVIHHKLSPGMKLTIARAPKEMRGIMKEVADLLQDIVVAVEEGRDSLPPKLKWGPSLVLNKAIQDKAEKQAKEVEMKMQMEKKRQQRAKMIKKLLENDKKDKEIKLKEDMEKKKKIAEEQKRKLQAEKDMLLEKKKSILEARQMREEEEKKKKAEIE